MSKTSASRKELSSNNVINSMCSALSGNLYPIDEKSEKLFYEYLKLSAVDRSAFAYNWPYIIQATRGQGFYYQHQQSIVYFYLRENLTNSKDYTVVVVNQLGYDSEASICEIAEVVKKLNLAIIVKNIDRDKIFLWNSLGFKETVEPWSRYSFRDDNTLPEFVYDIKKFINLKFNRTTKQLITRI